MDYLDPHKQLQHRIVMLVGYVCIAVAIIIATLILLYQAYGFGLGKNGAIIQNGLVFVSSQPNPADIYLNGKLNSSTTDARLLLPAGIYKVRLTRNGYQDWQRTIGVNGGTVIHFDYPLLIPSKLITTKLQAYSSAPTLVTQSSDRRWMLVQVPGSAGTFDVYDLKNPNPKPTTITLSSNLVGHATTSDTWQLVSWGDDNQHVVLQHVYDGKTEFILLDRPNPDQSLNLTSTLNSNAPQLTLNNKKYDQYYLYNPTTGMLQTASLNSPTPVTLLSHVLAYQSYGSNTVLYVTSEDAPAGKVLVKLMVGDQTYIIHSFPAGDQYLLNLTTYNGTLYVAAGASSENKVYIYRDPIAQLLDQPSHAVVPIQVLHVPAPNYLSFSANAQFIMVENGTKFGVYDLENEVGYNYSNNLPLDAPQSHATWMDGDRLTYVSGGKLVVFDYDSINQHVLMPSSPSYLPAFSTNYRYVYTLSPVTGSGQMAVTQTSLLIPADQ